VPGSIDNNPEMIEKIIPLGGLSVLQIVSAEQRVQYFRKASSQ